MAKRTAETQTEPVERRAPSLRDLVGQDRAVELLRAVASGGRVHHAWIFSGPFGVGKRTAAEAFAALLLDPTTGPNLQGEFEPDPDSPTQQLIARGSHPDLHLITKELAAYSEEKSVRNAKLLTIPKAVIEEHLLKPIALSASIRAESLAQKVFIIDEAELMDRSRTNAPVQNSILKTLEEPAPGSVIILVTSNEDLLLPTIRSRCQRVVFGALDEAAMKAWFARAEKDGLELAKDERAWVERFAQGSPGRALMAAETGLYRWAERLESFLSAAERGTFSPEFGRTMKELVGEWAEEWVKGRANASKEAANQTAMRHLIGLIGERGRHRLRDAVKSGDPAEMEACLKWLDALSTSERLLLSPVNMEMALETAAVGLAAAGRG